MKRTDLGSQYPKERFKERIATLVNKVSISLVARNQSKEIIGVGMAQPNDVMVYNRIEWTDFKVGGAE